MRRRCEARERRGVCGGLPDGQLTKTLSIPSRKNILIYRIVVSDYTQGHPGPAKGRSSVVTSAGRVAVDAASVGHAKAVAGRMLSVSDMRCADERRLRRTAKPCGPGCRCYSQALRRCIGARPGLEASLIARRRRQEGSRLRGERGIRRQTIAQGRPDVRLPCSSAVLYACISCRAADQWVPAGTRSSLRPLLRQRDTVRSKARAIRAARTRRRVCSFGGVECSNDSQSLSVTLRCRSEAEASKGDGPAASGPFILRGSPRDALRHAACASG